MGVKIDKLIEHYRRDPAGAATHTREAFAAGAYRPQDFDLGRLFEECFGWHDYAACRRKDQLATDVMARRLTEAEGAVTTAAFQNITGQIVYSAVLEKYEDEEFQFTKLIPETPTQFLDGEKLAGVTRLGDEVVVRNESDPYALAGVGEDWIFTPPVKDRGVIVPVTWEAIFADRTGQLLERAGEVGYWSGYNREVRAIDCVIDQNTTAHRYNWRGTVIATYGDNSGTHTWDNLTATNGLVDWTQVNAAEQTLNAITDPYTGAPVMIEPTHIVVAKGLEQTARRVISATEIRVATPGYALSANPTLTNMANPYANKYQLLTSRLLGKRLAAATDWFLGAPAKYAKYMVAEKMQVVQAPAGNQDEFHRRIVQQFRVNERGAYVVVQPRVMNRSTVA
jgi:hypothetical protein